MPLRGINWINKSGINASSCFKLVSFDTDDLKLLTVVYRVMYPERRIEESNLVETTYKFGSFIIWSTTYGCKNATKRNKFCQDTRCWPAKNGQVLQDAFFLFFFIFLISRHRLVLFYTFNQAWRGTRHALLCMCKMVFSPWGILFCKPN